MSAGTGNGDTLRARCAECLAEFQLKKDGTLRWHLGDIYVGGWRRMCAGVGKPPGVSS